MKKLKEFDLLQEWIGWEAFDQLDALSEEIYEAQQRGETPDLSELKVLNLEFMGLWDKYQTLEKHHRHNYFLKQNQAVLLLAMTVLWGAHHTIYGFDWKSKEGIYA